MKFIKGLLVAILLITTTSTFGRRQTNQVQLLNAAAS